MQHYVEKKIPFHVDPHYVLKNSQMTAAADGKKFSQSLNYSEYNSLYDIHYVFPLCEL